MKQNKQIRKRFITRFLIFLGSIGLAILNFMLLTSMWKTLEIGKLLAEETPIATFNQLTIIYPLIANYITISLIFICLTASIKGGFDKIKSYKDKGLIFWLIIWLIIGLIIGLIEEIEEE